MFRQNRRHVSKSDWCAGNSVGLFRRELPDSHLVDEAQRSLFLDLPRMKRDRGNLEARTLRRDKRNDGAVAPQIKTAPRMSLR